MARTTEEVRSAMLRLAVSNQLLMPYEKFNDPSACLNIMYYYPIGYIIPRYDILRLSCLKKMIENFSYKSIHR